MSQHNHPQQKPTREEVKGPKPSNSGRPKPLGNGAPSSNSGAGAGKGSINGGFQIQSKLQQERDAAQLKKSQNQDTKAGQYLNPPEWKEVMENAGSPSTPTFTMPKQGSGQQQQPGQQNSQKKPNGNQDHQLQNAQSLGEGTDLRTVSSTGSFGNQQKQTSYNVQHINQASNLANHGQTSAYHSSNPTKEIKVTNSGGQPGKKGSHEEVKVHGQSLGDQSQPQKPSTGSMNPDHQKGPKGTGDLSPQITGQVSNQINPFPRAGIDEQDMQVVESHHILNSDNQQYGKEYFGEYQRTINLYCLYDFKAKFIKSKVQALAQFSAFKHKPEYFTFERIPLKFGENTINAYHLKFPIFSQFNKRGFQLRVLDDTGTFNYDYYETPDKFREYGEADHHFIFDFKIEKNYHHTYYVDPPGNSVLEQFKQIFYFTQYLLKVGKIELLSEMIKQFRLRNNSGASLLPSPEQLDAFNKYYNSIIWDNQNAAIQVGRELSENLLQILGLLQSKNLPLRNIYLPNTSELLDHNFQNIIQELKTSIDQKIQEQEISNMNTLNMNTLILIFQKDLKLQGYINTMIFNKHLNQKEWHQTLELLYSADKTIYLIMIKIFLQRLNDNLVKVPFKIIFDNLIKIKSIKKQDIRFSLDEFQEIYMLFLEQPTDLKSYTKLLQSIYQDEVQNDNDEQEISSFKELDPKSENKILETINKFNSEFIIDFQSVGAFLQNMKSIRGTYIASLFQKSNAKNKCSHVLNSCKLGNNFTNELAISRQIFIDYYDRIFVKEDHFEILIDNLLKIDKSSFIDLFECLLHPWDDHKLNLLQSSRYLQKQIQRQMIAGTYITSFDEFIYSLQKLYQQQNLSQKIEREFFEPLSKNALEEIFKYCYYKSINMISYEFLFKVSSCKSKFFIRAYIDKVKLSLIDLTIRNSYNNPLDQLIQIDQEFQKNKKDSQYVKDLLDYAFFKSDDKPSEKNVMKELTSNPKLEHPWFRMIQNSARYKSQKQVSQIVEIVYKIAQNFWNQQFSIQEILDLKELGQRRSEFADYILAVLDLKRKQNEPALSKQDIMEFIKSQIAEAEQVIQKITEVKSFLNDFSNMSKDSPFVKNFEAYAKDFKQKKISELRTFPPTLENFQRIASKVFTFQNSHIFQQYLNEQKQINPEKDEAGIIDSNKVIENCDAAFNTMQQQINQFLTSNENQFKIKDVKSIIKEAQLNQIQIMNELQTMKIIFPGSLNSQMDNLINHLISLTQIELYEQICKSIINIASMEYNYKEPGQSQQTKTSKIFGLNLTREVRIASNFLNYCKENFEESTVLQFKISFKQAKDEIGKLIDDKLRYHGLLIQKNQIYHIEEIKENDGLMMNQQPINHEVEEISRYKDPQQKIFAILRSFNDKSIDLFKFIRQLTKSELDLFRDYVNDYDDSGVNSQTILDLVQVWEFVGEINRLGSVEFERVINFFVESLKNPLFKEMDDKIQKCVTHLTAIINFKDELDSKEQAKKKQVIEIMEKSTLEISRQKILDQEVTNNSEFIIRLSYKKNKDEKVFDKAAISELRDRALLLYNTMSHNFTKKNQISKDEMDRSEAEQKMMNDYVKFANLVDNIVKNLVLLQDSGFPKDHEIFENKIFQCQKSNFLGLDLHEHEIQVLLEGWEQRLIQGYQEYYPLTFLSGQQIWILESYLRGSNKHNFQNIVYAQNLLKYMGKRDPGIGSFQNFFAQEIESEFIMQSQILDHTHRFNKLCQALERLENIRGTIEDISFNQSEKSIDNQPELRRIVYREGDILYLETQKHFVGIISIFHNLNKPFPRADQLFFCQEDTNWQEIQSFMYRCIKDPKKELHCILKVEQLNLENQVKFTTLLQKLMREEMILDKFKLCIIATNSFSHVSDFIKSQDYRRIIKESNLLLDSDIREIVQQIDTQTKFVSSQFAGLGKTYYIKEQGHLYQQEVVFFPIAGKIDFKEIGERLSKIQFIERKILAFQISFVDKIQLLNEFLISIALFRQFATSNYLFILPKHSCVFIEISNTFDEKFQKEILYKKYLKQDEQIHHIDRFDISQVKIIDNQPPTQLDLQQNKLLYVCHQLNIYKEILKSGENAYDKQDLLLATMTNEKCLVILQEFFVEPQKQRNQEPQKQRNQEPQKQRNQEPNFIQLKVFERMMHSLLNNLTEGPLSPQMSIIFEQDYKNDGHENLAEETKKLKTTIINAILVTVREFTVRSINRSMQKGQNKAQVQIQEKVKEKVEQINTSSISPINQMIEYDEEEEQSSLVEADKSNLDEEFKMTLSWEESNHFTVIIIKDGSVIFMYRDPTVVDLEMRKMIAVQYALYPPNKGAIVDLNQVNQKIKNQIFDIPDFSSMSDKDLIERLKQLKTHSQQLPIENENYVVTADNYLKMCLIYLRVQSRVPVIIMGETGCGKTSLITFFCRNVLRDQLEILNIHAGWTTQMIIQRMNIFILKAKHELQEGQNLWIFFDEFNTSENLGIICEMLTDRKLLGESLPDNIILLAACNPYKLRSKKIKFDENVGIKRSNARSRISQNLLLYTVHPLPENVIEYVWDFGALTENDQKRYIKEMVTKANVQNVQMITQMLVAAHNYFKRNEDSSSVSLRDVSRFIILYKWFSQSLLTKKEIAQKRDVTNEQRYRQNQKKYKLRLEDYYYLDDKERDLKATILAICHCYYLRISSLTERRNFLVEISSAQTQRQDFDALKIEEILQLEQNDYICRMELTADIAVNQAIKENIFAIIPCIINRIPIFICGKPGCSKSLAITLIFSNLKGPKSSDMYFKNTQEFVMVSFQGSDSCTSEGIEKAYHKAKNYPNRQKYNLLPVFVFDEIGLAELSKYNPLKVLHSILEVENRDIGFVGISNWRLDASKMNRALYLARPDPGEDDLKFTAKCIFDQICHEMPIHHQLIKNLASAYSDLKQYLKLRKPEYQDFYGLRDFYHLIKLVSRLIANGANMEREKLIESVKIAIERNFGGKLDASKILGDSFAKRQGYEDRYQYIQPPSAKQLIRMNLEDRDARYLMLIGNPDILTYLMERIFRDLIQDSRIMVGSNLENDLNKEEYAFKSLNDIILYVEKGIPIILKGKDHIYSSLYDLFNQNFAVYGNKRYCRIALGAQMNPQCFVHDEFRCVIFMNDDEESLRRADAPFLNRFEKHYVGLDIKDDLHMKYIHDTITKNWIKPLLKSKMKERQILLTPTNIFPNYSSDMLSLIIQNSFEQLSDELSDVDEQMKLILTDVKSQLIELATQDIVILAQISDIPEDEKDFIISKYREIHNLGFLPTLYNFIEESQLGIESNISNKLLAFTYSVNLDLTSFEGLRRQIQRDSITVRGISNFKSEQELVRQLQKFYMSNTQAVQILEGTFVNDKQHIAFVKFIVDKVEKEIFDNQGWSGTKTVIILLHMQRNNPEGSKSSIPLFSGWQQKVYYEIQEQEVSVIGELLLKNTKQIIGDSNFIDFHSVISSLVEKCLLKLNYDGESNEPLKEQINENMFFIIEKLTHHRPIIKLFEQKIRKLIQNEMRAIDWRDFICCTGDIFSNSINIEMALKFVIENNIEKYLTILLQQVETHSAFRSYFTCEDLEQDEFIVRIWTEEFNSINAMNILPQVLNQSNYTQFIATLEFPFSRKEAEILKEIADLTTKFEEQEEQFRTPLEYFTELMQERSRYKHHLEHMRIEQVLQETYINDIVKIFLIDYRLNPEYLNIILIIIRKIMQGNTDFFEKLYTFIKNRMLLFMICQALDQFVKLKGLVMGKTIKGIEEKFYNALEELQFEKWEEMLKFVIDNEIINGSYPEKECLEELKTEENLAHIYENFHCTLRGIFNYIELEKIQIVKFWSGFVSLAAQHKDKEFQHFLWDIASNVKALENEDDEGITVNFLQNAEIVDKIIEFFNKKMTVIDEKVSKFVCQFYGILLDFDPNHISTFVKYIEQKNRLSESLFQFSSGYFDKIYQASGISQSVDNFYKAIANDEELEFHSELEQTDILEVIEDLLGREEIIKFKVALGDCIVKESLDVIENGHIYLLLPEFIASLRFIVEYDPLNDISLPNTKLLIAHSRMKLFINIYSNIIYQVDRDEQFEESAEIQQAMDRVTEELCVTDKIVVRTLQLYCLKVLMIQKYGMSIPHFKQYISEQSSLRERFSWMQNCDILNIDPNQEQSQTLEVLPSQLRPIQIGQEEEKKSSEFSEQSKLRADQETELKKMIENNIQEVNAQQRDRLKNKLKVIESVQDRINVGYAFMKASFINFAKHGFIQNESFATFFTEEVEEILEIKLGREYMLLIRHFVKNFPDRTILKMHPLTDSFKQIDANKIILMSSILILTYSYAKFGSPQSSQFFRMEENGVYSEANIVNKFLLGQEYSERMKFFSIIQQNFNTMNYKNGGNYQCSAQCEYIYFVSNCGWMDHRAEEAGKRYSGRSVCPWCDQPISGIKSGQEANYRHIKMTDANAKKYVDNKVSYYENLQMPGYYVIDAPDNQGKSSYYGLNPMTWRFLRLLLNVPLYHIQLQGDQISRLTTVLDQIRLQNLGKQTQGFLEMHITNDIEIFFKQLETSSQDHVAPWLFSILGDFQDLLAAYVGIQTSSYEILKQFQTQVDKQVFSPDKIANFAQVANNFKSLIRSYNSSERRQNLGLLDESYIYEVAYTDLSLYRLLRVINYEQMVQSFYNNQANQHLYPVLHLCIEHTESFQILSKFSPIIEFTNYLIKKLNLSLRRDEARSRRIASLFQDPEDGVHIKSLWDKFVEAWNSLNFQGPLQFGCQVNTYIKYDEDSSLNYFLVDDKEKEGGMCMAAALQQLAVIQSSLLKTLIEAYSMQTEVQEAFIIDTHQHPVQKLQQKHILDIKVDNYAVIQSCTLNKTEYGQGQQIVYDFARIEINMILEILQKKYMNTENFEFIQYQLEILTKQGGKANFVTEIRKRIKQEPFQRETLNYINQYLDSISTERTEKIRQLQTLHSGLEKIMCFLQNSNVKKEDSEQTLEQFCKRIEERKIESSFLDRRQPFYEVKLKNVIALYEIFEIRYFPHITQYLKPEFFNKKDDTYVRKQFEELLRYSFIGNGGLAKTQEELLPSGEKIQNAILRFMIRCLAGELNHNEAMKTYISPSKEDIWDEDVLENETQLYNFSERLSSNIKLYSIHSAYLIIQEWNTRQQQQVRPVGPVMEELKQEMDTGFEAAAANIVKPTESFKVVPKKEPMAKPGPNLTNKLLSKNKAKGKVM